jgi:hypothetical protein
VLELSRKLATMTRKLIFRTQRGKDAKINFEHGKILDFDFAFLNTAMIHAFA